MPPPKIKSGYKKHEPYPLNEPSKQVIDGICKRIVYLKAIGKTDMAGEEWSRIFADSIAGDNFAKPLGVADVGWNGCAWSVKTIQHKAPHDIGARIRLICGRNSVSYSAGIDDPFADVAATGTAVLEIYNSRINEAQEQHFDVRLVVLVRNMAVQEFALYERPLTPIVTGNYVWKLNRHRNFVAIDEDGEHAFTWQHHGAQFTVVDRIPSSATLFRINREPRILDMNAVLQAVRFKPDWIELVS